MILMLCLAYFGVAKAQQTQNVLTEDFSSMSSIATTYSATDWYAYNAGSGNNWTLSSGAAKYSYSSSSDANCYLVSAPFSVSDDMIELSVSLVEKTGGWAETFEVFFVNAREVTSAAAVVSATQYSAIASATYNNTSNATVSGSVTDAALAGQSVRVVVHCTSAADQYYLTVDDITVTETMAQGPYIMLNPTAETVFTGFTTTLTATYGNVTNPTISYTSSNTSVATVSGSGTTATVTGVSAGTATITATMNGTATATCEITVEDPSYCTPGTGYVDGDGISNVTFGLNFVVNNVTPKTAYGDYSNLVGDVEAGTTCAVDITYATGYTYGTIIWVDWDNSYTFEGTEVVYAGVSGSDNPTTLNATFNVPATIPVGDYRMRIIGADMALDSYTGSLAAAANANACGSYNYSTCHDYTLRVTTANPCGMPTNLQANQVGTTTANLSWDGTNDSYVLQYRTAAQDIMNMSAWHQVGEDVVTSHAFTQYSFDLSDYAGQTGYIAIRHYAVSDMFILAIDDIEITDANGTIVLTEGFDSGIPSTWDNIDYDGDGFVWGSTSSSYTNGNCAYSESYSNDIYSALTPDNWLIIPNVTLGGTLTLYALGLDSQGYHLENFGVFVAPQSYDAVPAGAWSAEIPVSTTSYPLSDLTANTAYEWRVKGICADYSEPSYWATSTFNTIDEGFKTFITEGNWDVDENWFPAGVPAITDKVAIAAPATIPANVVALAKKATIETGGSITIKEGGQLKQSSATLKLTMEKSITGYGNGNGNYYFIASPFSGRTQLSYASNWSHVLNVIEGNYDLYGFDPTSESEWINYESSSSHALFTSTNSIEGLEDGNGYLLANKEGKVLEFTGTAVASNNVTRIIDYTYDSESTDEFNGLKLVGNPYTCNAYINYVDEEGALLEANLYVLNQNGNGFKRLTSNELAPLTAAFVKVNASGKIQFSTEPIDASPALNLTEDPCLPGLPTQGEETDQDASCVTPVVCGIVLDENNEWFEDFEIPGTSTAGLTGTTMGECWTWNRLVEVSAGDDDIVPQIYNKSDFAHSGNNSLLLWNRGVYAMPKLDESININELEMSFYVRQSYSFYTLLVGVMTDPTDPTTFEPVAHIDNGSSTGVEYAELSFANYPGEGRYIAFKNVRPAGSQYDGNWNDIHSVNYIDDIKLSKIVPDDCSAGIVPGQYSETFENVCPGIAIPQTGVEPACWEMVNNDVEIRLDKYPQVYYGEAYAADGNYSLRMADRCVYALPALAESVTDITTLQLDMDVFQPSNCYQMQVGVWEDSTFVPVATVNNSVTTGYVHFTCNFSHYNGNGRRIAFRNTLNSGARYNYSYNYIDNIELAEIASDNCSAGIVPGQYTENFENVCPNITVAQTGMEPDCWEMVQADVELRYDKYPQVYYSTSDSYVNSDHYSLRLADRCVYAMPALAEGYDVKDLTLTMWVAQPQYFYDLTVGVWEENENGGGTFVPVQKVNVSSEGEVVSVDFSNYGEGPGRRIAFRNTLNSGARYNYSYNYIDDIELNVTEAKIAESSSANVIDEIGVERYLEGIVVYPNPTVGELHIGAVDVQKVECYNQMGQLVAVYNNDRDINISTLAEGVYTLRITVPQGVTMRKVVKR